jgi:Protein of unknown function (DUF3443)
VPRTFAESATPDQRRLPQRRNIRILKPVAGDAFLRKLFASLICVSALLAACGGGGGSTASTSSSSSSSSGNSSSGGAGSGSTTADNVANAIVDTGPAALTNANVAAVNIMYVKVTVCAPGSTTNCQTIDHVQVDTGSQGLRLLSSAITDPTLLAALQPVTVSGDSVTECTSFVDGYSWGPIVIADVHVGGSDTATTGESAPGISIQVIGSSPYTVPTNCSNNGLLRQEDTVASFGANGIIGVGLFDYDCGSRCLTAASSSYYTCAASAACVQAVVPESSQVVNPVFALAAKNGVTDNNGVIIDLPSVSASGGATVSGTLIFGIGTQSNNVLATGAKILATDAYSGVISAVLGGTNSTLTYSYLDSGSNAIYFPTSLSACTSVSANGFLCPTTTQNESATLTGANNIQETLAFSIADADTLFRSGDAAYNNLGGPAGTQGANSLALGLPFFFGRPIYTAMEHTVAGGTTGPYFAF